MALQSVCLPRNIFLLFLALFSFSRFKLLYQQSHCKEPANKGEALCPGSH